MICLVVNDMVDSYTATSVLVGFLLIFGVLLPILDKIPKVREVISLRWTVVVIYSALCIGVIIDFEHLDTSVRFATVVGGLFLAAIFLLVRSLEKAAVNRWKYPRIRGKVQKGNAQAELSVSPKLDNTVVPQQKDSIKTRQEEISNLVKSKQEDSSFEEAMNQALIYDETPVKNIKRKTTLR